MGRAIAGPRAARVRAGRGAAVATGILLLTGCGPAQERVAFDPLVTTAPAGPSVTAAADPPAIAAVSPPAAAAVSPAVTAAPGTVAARPTPARAAVPAAPASTAAPGCHPSYSGCLDAGADDYDCVGGSGNGPLYTGRVTVTGPDVFDLDRDGDGIGCE